MSQRSLEAATVEHLNLRSQLLAMFPELSEDERALADSLEGISDFNDQCLAVIRYAVEREAHAEALAGLIKQMQERKKRLEAGAEKMRAAVLGAMSEAGVKKIPGPDLSLGTGWTAAPLIITDPAKVPDELCKIEREPKKKEIAAWLKERDAMSKPTWATWGNPRMRLTVYSR
jgi:hypothetical protein